jgi:DNA invertase Pin-like site-specific DNA recombinase
MSKPYVAYYRVSTSRQGRSGLGLEAQREAVAQFLRTSDGNLISEFTEVESGSRNDRPELEAALAECRRRKATLAIARLDRLARNASFLLQLRDSNVDFTAADTPYADRFVVGILALVAERERDLISLRTKAALGAAKRRGTRLGAPDPVRVGALGVIATKAKVGLFDGNLMPIVRQIRASGVSTLRGIAGALNARGLKTRRSGQWSPEAVRLLLGRSS